MTRSRGRRPLAFLSTLDRKLARDLWRIKGQAAAIIFVLASGIALLVMARGMIVSLDETMRAYYDRTRFADAYAPVKRAPDHLLAQIRALPGVADADGRISGAGLVDIEGVAAPVSARALSIDPSAASRINDVHLAAGRMINPAHTDEVLVLEPFAKAHGLGPGDEIAITMYGAKHRFKIVGLALSAEFVYAIAPGELTSDPSRYAIIWASDEAMEAAYDLDGAFNEIILTTGRGANEDALVEALDRLLAPYGAAGAYGRADQVSNFFLVEELAQLETMTRVMTPIFLGVSVFLLNIVITRLVQTEREQIGLMKAFGYSNMEVGGHYLKFTGVIAVGGALLGWGGGLYLGRLISGIYQIYFHFPFLLYVPQIRALGLALAVSLVAAALGAFVAVRSAIRLAPAEAMRPPAPPRYRRAGAALRLFEGRLDQPSRMVLRRIARRPARAALSVLGVGAAMALSVMMQFNTAATDKMLDVSFNVVDRSDVFVTFAEPVSESAVYELARLDGVAYAEPVRSAPVLFVKALREDLGAITGLPPRAVLNRAVGADQRAVDIAGAGIVLSEHLAETLQVSIGDKITVEVREGRRPTLEIPVIGLIDALIGTPAYMSMEALNRQLKEPGRISGAYLEIDFSKRETLYEELKTVPKIAGVSLRREAAENFERMIEEGPGTFRRIMTIFSIVIAAGVVYNSARIAYIERKRDLASLRVLGFTKIETGYVLLGELGVLTIIALPVGAFLGYLLFSYIAAALSSELYQIPVVYREESIGVAGFVVILAAIVAGALVQRDVGRLEMASALKTRE